MAAALATTAPWRERILAWLWLALYGYLIFKRPHNTSIASAMLGALFLIGYFVGRMRSLAPMVATTGIIATMVIPQVPTWLNRNAEPVPLDIAAVRGDILYIPSNDWNPATPLWAFAYSGSLGRGPVTIDSSGRLTSDVPALRALFGEAVMLGALKPELQLMARGLARGMSVAWFRPLERDRHDDELMPVLKQAGATVEERTVIIRGRPWVLGRARVLP
jgi:hypothetical protein